MGFSFYEQETVITFNRAEDTAQIYTADPKMVRKLDELCRKNEFVNSVRESEGGKTYILPKTWIKVSKPRELTEAQKEAASKRMQEMRNKKYEKNPERSAC